MTKPLGELSLYKKINLLIFLGILSTTGFSIIKYLKFDLAAKADFDAVAYFSMMGITLLPICVFFFFENKVTKYLQVFLIFLIGVIACFDNPLAFDCIGLWSICFMLGFGHGLIRNVKIVQLYIAVTLAIFITSLVLKKDLSIQQLPEIGYFLIFYVIHLVAMLYIVRTKIDDSALLTKAVELDRFFSTELDLFCILDGNGRFMRANPEWTNVFGYDANELAGMTVLDFVHPVDKPLMQAYFAPAAAVEVVFANTVRYRRKDGEYRFIEWRATRHDSAIYASARDITLSKQHEEQLQTHLAEKNILVQEVLHRTKNNMQVIMSMIYLKAYGQADSTLKSTLLDINQRIVTMALAHQLLYKTDNLSKLDMKEYLQLLSKAVLEINPESSKRIKLMYDCVDLELLIDEAIPCGLLINELLTNSYRHAFPGGRPGRVSISLTAIDDKHLLLLFSDDGIGLPENYNVNSATSLGMSLIKSLSEYQLGGILAVSREAGLGYSVSFPINTHKERVFHEYFAG